MDGEIVFCSKCGQKNRIYLRAQKGTNRCGRCSTVLPDVFTAETAAKFRPAVNQVGVGWMLKFCLIALLFIGLVVWAAYNENNSRSARLAKALPTTPTETKGVVPEPEHTATESVPPEPEVTASPLLHRSLPTGTTFVQQIGGGHGRLKVENGTNYDALIKIFASDRRIVASCYVRAGDYLLYDQVPDDRYAVLYSTGEDWDGDAQQFTRKSTYSRMDKIFEFRTTSERNSSGVQTSYTEEIITLNIEENGNLPIEEISAAQFNSR